MRRVISVPGGVLSLVLLSLTAGCGDTGASFFRALGMDRAPLPIVDDTLRPFAITEPVRSDSEDPAIWLNPRDPAHSFILGTDKDDAEGGLYVFGLDGQIDRSRSVTGLGRMNNVDVEYGLLLRDRRISIAVASDRTHMLLRVFRLPEMLPIDRGGIPVFDGDRRRGPMGIGLYRRPGDGAVYTIVSGKSGPTDGTYLWQYRLEDDGTGHVRGVKVREFGSFSGVGEIEAIAVDDALGYVYYSDERFGIRKYHADPDAGDAELALFGTTGFGRDREGIAIFNRDDNTGYILVSDQHENRLHVFPREGYGGDPRHHPALAVIPVITRLTDGMDITPQPIGADFPKGMLVMMSSDRTFHFYRWEDVEELIVRARQ